MPARFTGEWKAEAASRAEATRRWVTRAAAVLRGSGVEAGPYRPARDGPLATFDYPTGQDEVDRYWVNAPYAYAVVTYDDDASVHRYYAVEPDLDEFEAELLSRVKTDVRTPLLYGSDGDPSEGTLATELTALLREYGIEVGTNTVHTLLYYLHRDFVGYDRVDPLMRDPHIEDISCDGYDLPLFAYHDSYADIATNVSFGEEELDTYVIRLAQRSGRHVSVSDPVIGTTLPNGARVELALGKEVTPRGSAFTVRTYAEDPLTPLDLINYGTFSAEQMAHLWLCIENNRSLIFAGGTASGKTTAMNAVSMFIPPRAKVLTIEDTRELSLHHENWLSSVTRERLHEGNDIDMYDLLRSALRHRPEYILVGEVRGEEAITLFQAMNTGHTTFSTIHADSVETVINRLENEPIGVPRAMVQSLDLLCVQTLTRVDGERVRRSKVIGEIDGIDPRTGELDYSNSFTWNAETDAIVRNDSHHLAEIADERGWSRTRLRRELRNRQRFLEHLRDRDVTDYRRFTALINEYYADPAAALDRIDPDGTRDGDEPENERTADARGSDERGDDGREIAPTTDTDEG